MIKKGLKKMIKEICETKPNETTLISMTPARFKSVTKLSLKKECSTISGLEINGWKNNGDSKVVDFKKEDKHFVILFLKA